MWICTSDGASSHITILQQHQHHAGVLKDVGSFDLFESQVTAMEYVKSDIRDNDTVWMATDNRKIYFYDAVNPGSDEPIGYCSIPGVATQILHYADSVIVALTNGNILFFKRNMEGSAWMLKEPVIVHLGNDSIPSILPINACIYAACGKNIHVLNCFTGDVQKTFDIQHGQHGGGNNPVNLMAHSGIGLWVSLKNSSIICLYHTETFKHLQDMNIATSVLRVTSSQKECINNNSSVFVTALMACKGLLWVGTNVGIALTIPLPRLEGVPIMSGGVTISYHAHFGPITFLLPLIPKTYHSGQIRTNVPANKLISQKTLDKEIENATSSKSESVTGSSTETTPRKRLEKQSSMDCTLTSISAKLRAQLSNSPVMLRRKTISLKDDSPRASKTLPRGLGSAGFFSQSINSNASSQGSEQSGCDVYGLYGDLIFVKEDYDHEEGQGNLMDPSYETMRRSDPELAAIPAKVSTLDRRLRMKVSRPRSLDLSNWSVESKSSSVYTSSGSEESMAVRHGFYGRSVSRNSSNASHKTELNNITENSVASDIGGTVSTAATPSITDNITSTPLLIPKFHGHTTSHDTHAKATSQSTNILAATLKKKKNAKNVPLPEVGGRRTVISLMGGRGYINWRHVWYATNDKSNKSGNSMTSVSRTPNSNDAHIVVWEKKL